MTTFRSFVLSFAIASASLVASAQTADEHNAHHPQGAAPQAQTGAMPAMPMNAEGMGAMREHMQAMRALHDKMMAGKSPAERQALLAEHDKLMQDGMRAMMAQGGGMGGMGAMHGAGKGMSSQMMEMCSSMMAAPAAPAQ